jgi:hypothetical protein
MTASKQLDLTDFWDIPVQFWEIRLEDFTCVCVCVRACARADEKR